MKGSVFRVSFNYKSMLLLQNYLTFNLTSGKSQLSIRTLGAVLMVKFNMREESCSDVCALLEENSQLSKK